STTTDHHDFAFTPNDNGAFVVSLSVTDDDGGVTTKTVNITVTNVNPTASISGAPTDPITEGTGVDLTATAADVSTADTLSYAWTVTKDGDPFALPSGADTSSADFSFTPTDNGSYVATCVVTDDDGGSVTAATDAITVNNVNPTASISGAPDGAIDEGSTISLTAHPSDAGAADTFTYDWTVTKDGDDFALPEG